MSITFEQAYNMLQTLNIDFQGFNNYLNDILNTDINKSAKDDIKKETKKEDIIKLVTNISNKSTRWADYDDEDDDTESSTSETLSNVSDVANSISDTTSVKSTLNIDSKPMNYLSVASESNMESEGFKCYTSKKNQQKNVIINKSTNPMFQDYGLDDNQTVYDRKDMALAISEKWIIGTEYQIHPNAFCPTMMNGCICTNYCTHVHLHNCKFEINGKTCKNSKCQFLHSRDMPTKEAYANHQQNLKKC